MNDFPTSQGKQVLFVMVAAYRMKLAGLTVQEIRGRFHQLGFQKDFTKGLAANFPDLARKLPDGRMPGAPRVFVSHSHRDRETASYVENVLEQNEAQTFLDQHQITPGQDLSNRLLIGLFWCDYLLLVWSKSARDSEYVEWEWTRAKTMMKTIIPYKLDRTPLPEDLSELVFISSRQDQSVGHAKLLGSIFGRGWQPDDPAKLFPGTWQAVVNVMGFGEAEYELQLRADGEIIGSGWIRSTGFLGGGLNELGMGHLAKMKIPITGSWSYDDRGNTLLLDVTASFVGQSNRDIVQIQTTGKESGWLTGMTQGGMPWKLRRK
jgi:hypothetical protein